MKIRIYILLSIVALGIGAYAENVEHEDVLYLHYGGAWLQDQYLTPLLYRGQTIGIGNEWWQGFQQESRLGRQGKLDHWQHVGKIDLGFAWTYSPTKNNLIYQLGIQAGWGAHYVWKWQDKGVQLFLGPYLDVDGAIKLHGRYVNKPVSVDACIHAMAQTGVSYAFKGKKTSYRLRYLIAFNLIGVDWIPDYWQSYYEISEGIIGRVRCAGMWNDRLLKHELTLDMQFPHSTWRVGIRHQYHEYGEKNLWFSREQVEAVVGTCFRYRIKPNHDYTIF